MVCFFNDPKGIKKHPAYSIFLGAVCSCVGGRGRFMHNPLRLLSNDLDARSSIYKGARCL